MNDTHAGVTQPDKLLQVRPAFLLAFLSFSVIVVCLITVSAHPNHALKRLFLSLAALALALGWFFLIKDWRSICPWRAWVALITTIYATISLPVFLFEMNQIYWLALNPMHRRFSAYVSPWVHSSGNGLLLVFLGLVGSFYARGRSRIALIIANTFLLVLRFWTIRWVF